MAAGITERAPLFFKMPSFVIEENVLNNPGSYMKPVILVNKITYFGH